MGISLGLVGLGSFGSEFANLFHAHPLVSRIALCDTDPDRINHFANKPAWRTSGKLRPSDLYSSLDAICKTDLDALVVITQHWLHAPQCIQALSAGKHVYSAVPVITLPDSNQTLDYCDQLVKTVQRTGLHYMLGETTYYHPEAMFCRRQARNNAFGDFTYTEGEYFHAFDNRHCDLRTVYVNRFASAPGQAYQRIRQDYISRGILGGPMHYPTHSVSGPTSVMNAHALKVSCFGQKPISSDPFFADSAFSNQTALYQMSNGSVMRIAEHRECSVMREAFRIYGTKACYENGSFKTQASESSPSADEMRDPLPPEVVTAFKAADGEGYLGGHNGSHAYLVHEFVDAIAHRRAPAIDVYQAVRYTAAGAVAHLSALKDGELLAVPDWGDSPR